MNRGRGVPSEAGGAGECVHSGGAIGLGVAVADRLQRCGGLRNGRREWLGSWGMAS